MKTDNADMVVYVSAGWHLHPLPETTPTVKKLGSFLKLSRGWHYGDGAPIDEKTYQRALRLYAHLSLVQFTKTDAFAGDSGEVLLTAYHNEHYIGLVIEPDGSYSLRHEVSGDTRDEIFSEDVSLIRSKINNIAREVWNLSGFSTQKTLTPTWGVSTISVSSADQMVGCLSSYWTAPKKKAKKSVPMRENTMVA